MFERFFIALCKQKRYDCYITEVKTKSVKKTAI